MRWAISSLFGAVSSRGSAYWEKFKNGLLSRSQSSADVPDFHFLTLRPPIPPFGICGPIFSGINDSFPRDSPGGESDNDFGMSAGEFGVIFERWYGLRLSL